MEREDCDTRVNRAGLRDEGLQKMGEGGKRGLPCWSALEGWWGRIESQEKIYERTVRLRRRNERCRTSFFFGQNFDM